MLDKTLHVIDLNGCQAIQIQVSEDGTKVWVNVDGICRLRAYACQRVEVEDNRETSEKINDSKSSVL